MRTTHRSLAALCIIAAAMSATAQTQMPAELKSLDWMVGEWKSEFNMTMQGQTAPAKGVMVITNEGMFLKYKATFDIGGFSMLEEMFLGYDPAKKKYFLHAFTNVGATPRIEYGSLVDGRLVMVNEPWGPAGAVAKSTLWLDKEKMKFVMDVKEGEKWTPAMDSTWEKVKKQS